MTLESIITRSSRSLLLLSATLAVALLAGGGVALAHAPIYLGSDHTSPDSAAPLGDPASAGLIYGALAAGGAQYLSFSVSGGQPFHALVLRPLRADSFNPALALVGPGLSDAGGAPFAVPDGAGVRYLPPPDQSLPIFIADLGLRFLAGAGYDGPLPQDGDYCLVVCSADGNAGDYTVGTGYGL